MPSMTGEESLAIVWLSPSVNLAALIRPQSQCMQIEGNSKDKLSVASKQQEDV